MHRNSGSTRVGNGVPCGIINSIIRCLPRPELIARTFFAVPAIQLETAPILKIRPDLRTVTTYLRTQRTAFGDLHVLNLNGGFIVVLLAAASVVIVSGSIISSATAFRGVTVAASTNDFFSATRDAIDGSIIPEHIILPPEIEALLIHRGTTREASNKPNKEAPSLFGAPLASVTYLGLALTSVVTPVLIAVNIASTQGCEAGPITLTDDIEVHLRSIASFPVAFVLGTLIRVGHLATKVVRVLAPHAAAINDTLVSMHSTYNGSVVLEIHARVSSIPPSFSEGAENKVFAEKSPIIVRASVALGTQITGLLSGKDIGQKDGGELELVTAKEANRIQLVALHGLEGPNGRRPGGPDLRALGSCRNNN